MANCHSVGIDEACLLVSNDDYYNVYELWAQSVECFQCPPWRYLFMNPERTYSLKVNTTYGTDILLYNHANKLQYRMKYHFDENGIYRLAFNSSMYSPISSVKHGNNEYNVILIAIFLHIFIYFIWICILGLHSRMQEERSYARRQIDHVNTTLIYNDHLVNQRLYPQTEVLQQGISLSATRLRSLDTFRGITIVLMIFVNYGGGKFYFFQHARWNGLTIADLVFPWFLWIMGVSLTFSIKSQLRRMTPYYIIFLKIIRRSLILFMLGMVINSLQSNYVPTLRIPGVLQRFAICYAINASLEAFAMKPQDSTQYFRYWHFRDLIWSWFQWIIILSLVLTSIIFTFYLAVPGCPRGYLGPGGLHANGSYSNCTGGAAGYVDLLVFGKQHLHSNPSCKKIYNNPGPFDPEGALGTLMSCLTVQIGVATGRILITYSSHTQQIKRWLIWALFFALCAGFLCHWSKEDGWIPVNKNLWSLSFVCVTGCFAFILFSIIYYIVDVINIWNGTIFRIAGLNSILLYIGHEFTGKLIPFSWSPIGKNHTEHMCMDLWGTSLWVVIAYACHKKKLYFTI